MVAWTDRKRVKLVGKGQTEREFTMTVRKTTVIWMGQEIARTVNTLIHRGPQSSKRTTQTSKIDATN